MSRTGHLLPDGPNENKYVGHYSTPQARYGLGNPRETEAFAVIERPWQWWTRPCTYGEQLRAHRTLRSWISSGPLPCARLCSYFPLQELPALPWVQPWALPLGQP